MKHEKYTHGNILRFYQKVDSDRRTSQTALRFKRLKILNVQKLLRTFN